MRIRFKLEQIQRWRVVDLQITTSVANRSNKGANFNKCSKSEIYNSFEEGGHGYSVDREKFATLMDRAAKIVANHKRQLQIDIGEMLSNYGKSA